MQLNRSFLGALCVSALMVASPLMAAGEGERQATMTVGSSSAFLTLRVNSFRKIGKVTMVIVDANGRCVYREEGKALSDEIVRVLDRRALPGEELTITVTARDLAITQVLPAR